MDATELLIEDLAAAHKPGRKTTAQPSYVRDLTEADLQLLLETPVPQTNVLQRLRSSHHELARLLASGQSNHEVAAITGRSHAAISHLKSDPAFAELIEFYKDKQTEVMLDAAKRRATLATTAIEILQERLEESPEKIATDDLVNIVDKVLKPTGGQIPGAAAGQPSVAVNIRFESPPERAPLMQPVLSVEQKRLLSDDGDAEDDF